MAGVLRTVFRPPARGGAGVGVAHFGADVLRIAQQVEDGAGALHGLEQRIDLGAAGRRVDVHGVADLMRPDGRGLVAGPAAARVDDARDLDLQALHRHLSLGRLDQKDVGDAGAQHAQLQLGRAGAEVVAREVGRLSLMTWCSRMRRRRTPLRPSARTWALRWAGWAVPAATAALRASTAARFSARYSLRWLMDWLSVKKYQPIVGTAACAANKRIRLRLCTGQICGAPIP
ncbi:hypothetical protein GY14_00485 [Delftia tsuruhatensis]|nr:hypothetical protein GY14_00485 [Delftia tsuruhatensis]